MTRHHDLDALRAFAMLLGVLMHGALFLVSAGEWPVRDEWADATDVWRNPYAYLISVVHGFRMPVFFLLSGFFTAMLWQSRGWRRLAGHRLRRVGLPLVLAMLTIVPVNSWIFEGKDFDPLLEWPFAWLDGFDHLWFLWYLLWLMVAFVVSVGLGLRFRHRLWWLLVPLAAVPQYFMVEAVFGADAFATTTEVLPPLRLLGYYAAFFFFGVFFHLRGFEVRGSWAAMVLPAVLLVFPASLALLYPERVLGSTPAWSRSGAAVLQVVYSWLMCFGFMGLFHWVVRREHAWVRYISDASYWVYLWHLPLVVLGQMAAVSWAVSPHLKFIALCLGVVAVLLAVYEAAVRYTMVGTMLNGPRTRPSNPSG